MKKKNKDTTQYVLDSTMPKQTQIAEIRHGPSYLEVKTNHISVLCDNCNGHDNISGDSLQMNVIYRKKMKFEDIKGGNQKSSFKYNGSKNTKKTVIYETIYRKLTRDQETH